MKNPHQPQQAEVIERIEESPSIFTLRIRFCDADVQQAYSFLPGQFNMLYLHGVGEVPISIVSDPMDVQFVGHTIRAVGRVTNGLAKLQAGDRLGVRGPYGRGWPMDGAEGQDVVIITGGLGCAPVVSVINYVLRRRESYGRLTIMQGVKHSADLIWREQYERWRQLPNTQVLLAADQGGQFWPWHVGNVSTLFDDARIDAANSHVMMCGPEGMMKAVIREMLDRRLPEERLWLSMERNMQCGIGRCGHCQMGGKFVCKDGPVFNYPEVRELLGIRGI
jgi:sulfhydrogenase subunit gamma (sulfur reductase)